MFKYTTKVRVNPAIVKQEVEKLQRAYLKIDPYRKKDNTPRRSAFNQYNNLSKFYDRLMQLVPDSIPILKKYDDGSVLIEVTGEAKGNTTRIYFKPSITSLTKEVRKAIVPISDENIFVYTDLKAAEFALRAVQACDQEAINYYLSGEDIYMHFAHMFPEGASRDVIKKVLVALMYGTTPYTVSKDLGISEMKAQTLLIAVESRIPKFTQLKRNIISYDRTHHGYFSPDGFDQENLIKIADIDEKGFNPNRAWSVYTQSALGLIFQKLSKAIIDRQSNVECTFLSIFDSIILEIKKENLERFKKFITSQVSPLLPDGFHVGRTVYEAMYENR